MNKKRKCPFCGNPLSPKDITRKEIHNAKRYLIFYKCPKCGREAGFISRRLKRLEKTRDTAFLIQTKALPETMEIYVKRRKRMTTSYVEHNIITRNARIDHIGIEGLKGWKNKKVQFKDNKGRDLEFIEREYGKTVRKWKRKK